MYWLIREITDKDLLYSPGRYTKYLVTIYKGKKFWKENLSTYLNRCALHLKLTWHCKSTTRQFLKNMLNEIKLNICMRVCTYIYIYIYIYIINIYIKEFQPPTGPILYLLKILSSEDLYFSDLIFPTLVFCIQPGFLSIKCSLQNSSLALSLLRSWAAQHRSCHSHSATEHLKWTSPHL